MKLIHSRRELFAGIALLVLAIGINAALGFHYGNRLHQDWQAVAHTHDVLETIESIKTALLDAETGQRGYLITGDEQYLAPYQEARDNYKSQLEKLRDQTADNPEQQAAVPQLDQLMTAAFDQMKKTIDLRKNKGRDIGLDSPALGVGKQIMDDSRTVLRDLRQREQTLLIERVQQNNRAHFALVVSGLLGLGLSFLGVGSFLWLLRRYITTVGNTAAQLHHQREMLHAMLISIGDAVIATDASGNVTLLNEVAEELTGWKAAEAFDQPLEKVFNIVNETTRQTVDNPAARALREGRIVGLANHTILIARDGTECPIDDSAAPVRSQSQEISGAILVFREIRERKRQEAELQRQAAALQDADRRKDEFLAILAHELRNPLSPLSNALQIWPMVANDPAQLENLRQMMERQLAQMTRLIDDLLDVSRITRGKIELRKQVTDLSTLVSAAVESLQPMIAASEHQVTVDLPRNPIWLEGDVARLTQVFSNILHNAAKYTGRKGRIQVTAVQTGDSAVVRIKDNGPGIPTDMLTRIFDIFQQVDATLERSHGGLGIGLTLVKRLVEMHGGTVEARSEGANQGSEFIVTLPATAAAPRAEPSSASSSARKIPSFQILVVDDVEASAKTLGLMLGAIGQTVTLVHDGPSAIERIVANPPDIVFLDIAMPGMNGYEVARKLRTYPELREVFLVALTGYGQEDDRRRALDAGFNHHMTKPTSIDALQRLLVARPESTRAVQ